MKEESLLLLSDLQKLINQVVFIDYTIIILGGAKRYFGFAGLPFNLGLSTFLYYREVQSVAMYYGYDIKNDTAELVIANEYLVGYGHIILMQPQAVI